VLNSCPTNKKIHHRLCDLLLSHYCEMYGFQNTDLQLSFTSSSSTQLFMMFPMPVHQCMMPKLRGCLTHLCSCVDCTQLIHSLRMMYLADEQHNCAKKRKVSTSQTHRGFKRIKQPRENGHDHSHYFICMVFQRKLLHL